MRPAIRSRCGPTSSRCADRPKQCQRASTAFPTTTITASPAGASTAREKSSMSMREPPRRRTFAAAAFALLALSCGAALAADTPGLGKPISEADIKGWNVTILPDGAPSLVEAGIEADKTIGNFWADPTTLFDYIRRAMPWPQPRTLSDEEVYSLCAYVFALNKFIGENDVMDAQTLPKVKLPNRGNFIIKFPSQMP